ncbi:MAG: 30S ribosomal protein S6 [Nitrospirales bacterium]|nr:30S ribosomal protein S6 [Nitrospirales bacterium]
MRLYESVCILHPSQSDEETGKVVEKMKEILERSGATIVKLENEGKKKLSYDIQHERRGTYITMQFQGGNKVVDELEHYHRMEDAVMKFMTVRVPKDHQKPIGEAEPESQDGGVQ